MANKPIHYHLASKEVKFGKFAGKTILQAIAQRTPTPATHRSNEMHQMSMRLTLLIILIFALASCRTSYRTHQTSQTDSLTLTRTLHGDIFQIHERFDTLGRLISRSQTLTRSSDSISLNTQSKQTSHAIQKTEPTTTTHLISSSKQTLTLIGFGIALGIVIAFLIKRKLLS